MDILINVTNKIAETQGAPVMVCGNSDYNVLFTFDAEWEGLDPKLARFVFTADGKLEYIDVPFTGDTARVPVLSNIDEVYVGVYAGELHTTTPARVYCKKSILCGDPVAVEPDPSLYGPVLDLINEVAAARHSSYSGHTFASLSQRLKADFAGCVRQNVFERIISSLTVADNETAARVSQLETDVENLQSAEGTIKEVIDARYSVYSESTFASLSQRLNADFAGCVRQGNFERIISNLTAADNETAARVSQLETETNANSESVSDVERRTSAAETDINALQASVENLQNNGVKTAATAGEALNKANAALSAVTHVHDNKAVLDTITASTIQSIVTTQQKAQANAADIESLENGLTVVNGKATEALNKADACLTATHGHSNKAAIDTVTSNNIAAWNAAANDADRANERLDTIDPMIMANQTNINALQASIKNLQDNGVKTAATAGEALNKANAALSGLTRNADLTQTTIGTPLRKNLLPYPDSITKSGVTFTCDENGYMSCSTPDTDKRGLSIANAQYSLFLRAGTYVLSFASDKVCTSEYGYIWVLNSAGTQIKVVKLANNESGSAEFTIDSDQTVYIFAKIFDGKVASMIRYASISDGTYEPYTPSIQEQIDELRAAIEAMGATTTTEV